MIGRMKEIEKQFAGFSYPYSLFKVIEFGLIDYGRWYLMPIDNIVDRKNGLESRYNRKLIPFARRGDNDDIACFEVGQGERVFIIHDFATSGWERRQEYDNFWEWFKIAIDEMIEFEIEEESYLKQDGV